MFRQAAIRWLSLQFHTAQAKWRTESSSVPLCSGQQGSRRQTLKGEYEFAVNARAASSRLEETLADDALLGRMGSEEACVFLSRTASREKLFSSFFCWAREVSLRLCAAASFSYPPLQSLILTALIAYALRVATHATACAWRSEDNVQESALSCQRVVSGIKFRSSVLTASPFIVEPFQWLLVIVEKGFSVYVTLAVSELTL